MAITTKFGDKGKTTILFGHVVDKSDPLLDVAGTVDELNANIGVARASVVAPGLKQELLGIQQLLFVIGAEVATRPEDMKKLKKTISQEEIDCIDSDLSKLEEYNNIDNWFIPGESLSSALIEKARTIARRLERRLVQRDHYNDHTKIYLNRLSDYLWLLAQKEEYYLKGIEKKSTEQQRIDKQQTIHM
jgi:cob(I)alamin adenosyltransferase